MKKQKGVFFMKHHVYSNGKVADRLDPDFLDFNHKRNEFV